MRRTGIVCTIGPQCLEDNNLDELHRAGLTIARLNGSHANLEWHDIAIKKIQKSLPDVPILLDIPGRKIRTKKLEHEPCFNQGDTIILTTDQQYSGLEKTPVNYSNLHQDISVGAHILADDGTLAFSVYEIKGRDIYCKAQTPGILKSKKGINVPFVELKTPLVTDRDKQMIDFAKSRGIDFVGLSFVESAAHISLFRELIGEHGLQIVAKVENQGGLNNLQEIVEATDAIMIDRGDLSVETSLYDVSFKQKKIIKSSQLHGKPVIVATEMLHTMIENLYPTKAEVSDISNAVLDGCSATMLSGETAVGAHPVEAVKVMAETIDAAESYQQTETFNGSLVKEKTVPEIIGAIVPLICKSTQITKIVAITRSGYAARMISNYQLAQPIIAVTDNSNIVKALSIIAGATGFLSDIPFSRQTSDHVIYILEKLWREGHLTLNDKALVTGLSYPSQGERMNTVQIHSMSELVSTQGWH